MGSEKPTITRAQDKAPEPKKLNRAEKWRLERAKKKKQKLAIEKARAEKEAKERSSYLDAISSNTVTSETKQPSYKKKTPIVSTPKKTTKKRVKPNLKKLKVKVPKLDVKRLAITGGALLLLIAGGVWFLNKDGTRDISATLGDSDVISGQLPEAEPQFSMLFPVDADASAYDIRQTNPPGTEPAFTYLDRFTENGVIFQVTQQKVPEGGFDVVKAATDFQATNIIQVDETTIYHGYNERDNVQSLIFIKDNLLFSIRSPQKFSDDQWAGYIVSLQ